MTEGLMALVESVIAEVNSGALADGVLRRVLAGARGVSRQESGEVVRAVFRYYRWLGWLGGEEGLGRRLELAERLEDRFQSDPLAFGGDELQRAVPAWVFEEVDAGVDWLRVLQQPPRLWLRARRGEGVRVERLLNGLEPGSATAGRGVLSDCIEFAGETDLFRTAAFQSGEFEIQDVASQWVGLVCAPRGGEVWWDACAGEGGKLLHLSDLMGNKGVVWGSDRSERRLASLRRRAARARCFNYRVAAWSGGEKLPTRTQFSGVLVDAPCSGVGTWQRNPHARWCGSRGDVTELAGVQERLLGNASVAVKVGGRLVYSVCTLTRSETTDVVRRFSATHGGFELERVEEGLLEQGVQVEPGVVFWWPQHTGGNGMMLAQWRRCG